MRLLRLTTIIILALATAMPSVSASQTSRQKASAKQETAKKQSKRKSAKKSTQRQKTRKQETSAEMKRRQQATQQEIRQTREQIEANDKAVKAGLADLGRISSEIEVSRRQVADISAQVNTLNNKIGTLTGHINSGEKELQRMRAKYLEAVRKIRLKKGKQSTLAFIFSSKNFSEAMRRMRYLKQFSEWRDKQSSLIAKQVQTLKYQSELLTQTKSDKDRALNKQIAAQRNLESQHARQDIVVADLRKNGEALRSHLARKQAEANDLKSRIATLIAREQAEEARKREEERIAKERREAEERRLAEERRIAEERRKEELLAQSEAKSEERKAEKAKPKKTEPKKKESKKHTEQTAKSTGGDYAQARKRRPRDNSKRASASVPATEKIENTKNKAAAKSQTQSFGNFAAAKGNLPRPVSGAFRITSPFGRHPLPDLPDVVYDNPGIDAQVGAGASAQAVFAGRVSGVYMLPGFNTVVIVNHGGYYTIYGNIASASVKVGDNVKQGQSVGKLAIDPDSPGHSTIHFEVWKNREKQNPANWIR